MSRTKKARKIVARTGAVMDTARTALSIMRGSEYAAIGYIFAIKAEGVPKMAPEERRRWNEAYAESFGQLLGAYDAGIDIGVIDDGPSDAAIEIGDSGEIFDPPLTPPANPNYEP